MKRGVSGLSAGLSATWLMVPGLVFAAALIAFPVMFTLWLSLHDYQFGRQSRFHGVGNYLELMRDPVFWQGLRISLTLYVVCLAAQLGIGLWLGLLLNARIRGRKALRTVLISPFVLPGAIVGLMWLVILDPSIGPANYLLNSIGLPRSDWLASPHLVVPVIALIDTWQWSPFVALIVLGGLQTLPDEPYEAAWIDGATRTQAFLHLTLPMLLPTLLTAAILRSVDLLRFFDLIYVTTQGGPGNASTTLNIYAYKRGFEFFDMGKASAIMVVLLLAVMVIVGLLTLARRRLAQ
jgi:multiple sugar transport system permease protein